MNILHHKSWHVRNKDNIQRVKRDEDKAAAEENEKKKRATIAESEVRLNLLRARSASAGSATKLVEYDQFLNVTHVNLFEQEEQGKFNEDKNAETELEKKKEQEKFEKKIGLLNYLVDDERERSVQPWCTTTRDKSQRNADPRVMSACNDSDGRVETDLKRKLQQDPMTLMNSMLSDKDKNKKKKKKEEKAAKRHKTTSEPALALPTTPKAGTFSGGKTIEQLRAERLKRESEEKLKAARLLSGNSELGKKKEPAVELDDRKRKYNNQFNPDFTRF